MNRGAVVLCGGKSTRMGVPKAMLPFGNERMLQRVVRLVAEAVSLEYIAVVAAENQQLPPLPTEVTIVRDQREGRGPLEGISAGLRALADQVDAVYATSCDVPLLRHEFVGRMFQLLENHEIAVAREENFHHPLAAVYRMSVLSQVEQLLAADQLRPYYLFEKVDTRLVDVEQLRTYDPDLDTLKNLNTPEDYLSALAEAGLDVPEKFPPDVSL